MSDTPSQPTMRAGVFLGGRRFVLQDLPRPQPGPGEVLARVAACGVCGTDNHIFEGEVTDGVFPPVVLGHEIAARIEAVGPGVEAFDEGLFCAIDPVIGCGVCRMCRSGRPNLCARPTVIGYKLNGGFAQHVLAPATQVVPLDESVGAAGGVLCETLACVINGYQRIGIEPGAAAMVLGAGTVGLLGLTMLRNSQCSMVLQTEVVGYRAERAAAIGADRVINPQAEDLATAVRDAAPDGLDLIVDATGSPEAVEQAVPLLAKGGTFFIFGVCPAGSSVRVDPFALYNKEARILSSKMPPATLHKAARLIGSGRVPCEQIVTTTVPLAELADAVEGFNTHRDDRVKVAVDPWA